MKTQGKSERATESIVVQESGAASECMQREAGRQALRRQELGVWGGDKEVFATSEFAQASCLTL